MNSKKQLRDFDSFFELVNYFDSEEKCAECRSRHRIQECYLESKEEKKPNEEMVPRRLESINSLGNTLPLKAGRQFGTCIVLSAACAQLGTTHSP